MTLTVCVQPELVYDADTIENLEQNKDYVLLKSDASFDELMQARETFVDRITEKELNIEGAYFGDKHYFVFFDLMNKVLLAEQSFKINFLFENTLIRFTKQKSFTDDIYCVQSGLDFEKNEQKLIEIECLGSLEKEINENMSLKLSRLMHCMEDNFYKKYHNGLKCLYSSLFQEYFPTKHKFGKKAKAWETIFTKNDKVIFEKNPYFFPLKKNQLIYNVIFDSQE